MGRSGCAMSEVELASVDDRVWALRHREPFAAVPSARAGFEGRSGRVLTRRSPPVRTAHVGWRKAVRPLPSFMAHARRTLLAWLIPALAALAALPAAPQAVFGQAGSAMLKGLVFDSTSMKPLGGAKVAVIGTRSATTANDEGRFVLRNIPDGKYWVSFFHPRLQELGVSPPSRRLEFTSGKTLEVVLAVPSERTLLVGWCMAEQGGPGLGAVAGVVTDSITGVRMPRATVVLKPTDGGNPIQVKTDDEGYYRVCNAPADRPLVAQAHFGNNSGPRVGLSVAEGDGRIENLRLHMSSPGTLTGIVLDYASGKPVEGARIAVLGTGQEQLTDSTGKFLLDDLPPGRHLVTTEHLAYASHTDSVTIFSEETVNVEVRLTTEPLEVEGLVVTARSRFGKVLQNVGVRADVITRAEIEPLLTRGVQSAGDVLRYMNVPGLNIREIQVQDVGGVIVPGICVEVSRHSAGADQCNQASVFLNDVYMPYPDQILRDLDPQTIERIEILNAIDSAMRFGNLAPKGAVLIYTR